MANDFRYTDGLMDVNYSITNKRSLMNDRFQSSQYSEAINYARSMLESTCKYVYHEVTGEEAEIAEGRNDYISLKHLSDVTIDALSPLVSHAELLRSIKDNVIKVIVNIGKIRNNGSASHGSRIRNVEPQREETLYVMGIAENTCNFLLKLLYARTHIEESNVVGGMFNESELGKTGKKFASNNGDFNYKIEGQTIDVLYWVQDGLVKLVNLTFKKEFYTLATDSESINEYIDDFLPEDVRGQKKPNGEKSFTVYSERHDRNFDIDLIDDEEGVSATISGIE